MFQFSHLLVEAKSKYSLNLKPYQKTHDILESVEGFSQIAFNYNIFPPIRIKTKPMIFILRRKKGVVYSKLSLPGKRKSEEKSADEETVEKYLSGEKEIFEDSPTNINSESLEQFVDIIPTRTTRQEENLKQSETIILDEETMTKINQLYEGRFENEDEANKIKEKIKNIMTDYKPQTKIEGEKISNLNTDTKPLSASKTGNGTRPFESQKEVKKSSMPSQENVTDNSSNIRQETAGVEKLQKPPIK